MIASRLLLAAAALSTLVACAGGRLPDSDPGVLDEPGLRSRRHDMDADALLRRNDQDLQPIRPGHALPIENGGDMPRF
jgi:hypothetical protein